MIRLALFSISFMLLADVYGQQPDFAIVGQDDGVIEEITVISGVSLQLNTNFTEVRGTEVFFPANDRTSSTDTPFSIGFSFEFFGQPYENYFIGANGYITFDNPPWNPAPSLTSIPYNVPTPPYPLNSIFGTFKGWEATSGNHVTRLTIGDAPDRRLIITWCEIPALQSDSNGSFQIILYESGEIEIHLIEIPFSNYAGNETAVGIQSSNPFQGLSAPQRNYGPWPPVSQESWRFRWVNSDYEVESINHEPFAVAENLNWYELEGTTGRNLISDQQQVSVTPKLSTRYLAEITSCWGAVITTAELSVIVEGVFPNAFNPRSSVPANRTFKMPVIPDAVVANYRLQVYNRWGQLVFETPDVNTGWNGRMQNTGQDCPAGVYHWIILVEENGKTPVTNSGAVMLLR